MDVLQQLPEKIIQDYYCTLSTEQEALYHEFELTTLTECEEALKKEIPQLIQEEGVKEEEENINHKKMSNNILGMLVKLRQICNHPDLLLSNLQ